MKRPVIVATTTKTSRAVRLSVFFVVATATLAALIGVAAVTSRLFNS